MSDSFNQFKKQLNVGIQSKRWSVKSITALVLFGAIIAVFALFGFPNRLNNSAGASGFAGQVNNALISVADLRSESARLEQMYAPMFGGQGLGDAQRQFVRQQALENLITQEVSSQNAKKAGILATDAEIQDMIVRELPYFQEQGRFQRDRYYQILQANRLTPADFEEKLRKEKVNVRTQRLFEAASQPLSFEIEKIKNLQESKWNVGYVKFNKEMALTQMKSTNAQAQLSNPEFLKRTQDYYNNNKAEFEVQPQVLAQHILIKIGKDVSEEQAKQKIEEIKEKSKTTDFGKLAAQYSQDQGSKVKNGDLGWFGKDRMVSEFANAAFSQKLGEVGEPVRTTFGYHLIKVNDRKEAGQKPFDQVQTEIAQKLVATDAYEGEVQALEKAIEQGDLSTVEAQIKKMGLKWEETGFFALNADMIPNLNSPEASKAVFALQEGQSLYPHLVKDGAERFILRLKATKKEPFVADSNFRASIERERANDLFGSWIENAKKTAKIERNPQVLSGR